MAPVLSQIDINKPGALAKKTNRSNVMNEYANQPIVLPVIKAHGVQFRLPNEPDLMAVNSDLIGAEKVRVDKMHPIVGAT
mmetsp:Transcript_28650/g.42748  ORF Transcript_28650/g.42748 Transcript_28650/m.42748 type:complete len:80 (-) Transcript_28650:157-396(-)